jgi:hypothetical protein
MDDLRKQGFDLPAEPAAEKPNAANPDPYGAVGAGEGGAPAVPTAPTPKPVAAPPPYRPSNPATPQQPAGAEGAGAPGAIPGQGQTSAPFYVGAAGGPAHAAGLSAADKAYKTGLEQQAGDLTDALREAVDMNRDAVAAHKANSDALAMQSQHALGVFQQDQAENVRKQHELQAQTTEDQKRIDAHLSELEATGINPDRYLQNQSTTQNIAQSILVGLGAFASRLGHGGPNVALDMMQQAVGRDLDAQRTNLQKSLELAGKRMQLNASNFEQQSALLRAERESTQTAYSVVSNMIEREAARFKDNSLIQQNAAKLLADWKMQGAGEVAKINERLYGLAKAGERIVGGSAQTITTKLRNGQIWTGPMAQYEQMVKAGLAEDVSLAGAKERSEIAKNEAGAAKEAAAAKGTKESPKERSERAAMEDAVADLNKMIAMREKEGGGSWSPEKVTTAEVYGAAAAERRLAGLGRVNKQLFDVVEHMIPKNPLEKNAVGIIGSDPTMAKMKTARQVISDELARRTGDSTSDEPAPAAVEKDEAD